MNVPIGSRSPETSPPVPETGALGQERRPEAVPPAPDRGPDVQPVNTVPPLHQTPAALTVQPSADQLVKNIEGAMADGLEDAYKAMDPATRQKFKQVGEATASAIGKLLEQSKIQVKKIVTLLLRWLRLIPQVNPYYLEQQAKIKADAIVALKHPPREGN